VTPTFEIDFIGLALLFLLAFLGAFIAHRIRQSMIVGYIFVGILLGAVAAQFPAQVGAHIFLDTGARTLRPSIEMLSDLGLAFLLFFIGLGFSVGKLKTAGRPSLVIALTHLSLNFYAGAVIGTAFGWDFKSTFFLAAVMSMSSLSVAAKSLIELKRLDSEETEYVLGSMIVEDFLTMVILVLAMGTLATGSISSGAPGGALLESVKGALIVYGTFIALALFLMPRLARYIERVRNDEVFTLLALACLLGSAALAFFYGMPFMLGAFFIGMVFSETRLSERMQLKLMSFRDALVAIFFVAFGLRVDLATLPLVIGPVVCAIVMIAVNDGLLVSSLAYMLGFNGRASTSLGASLMGRGGDSVLFASVGAGLTTPDGGKLLGKANQLYPFSGGVSLVTNFLVPVMLRKSVRLAVGLGTALPAPVRFSAASIGRAVRPSLGQGAQGDGGGRGVALTVLPVAYTVGCLIAAIMVVTGQHLFAYAAATLAALMLVIMYRPLHRALGMNIDLGYLSAHGHELKDHRPVADFVPRGVTLLLLVPLVTITSWTIAWWLSPLCALGVVAVVLAMGARTYAIASGERHRRRVERALDQELEQQRRRMQKRYKRK